MDHQLLLSLFQRLLYRLMLCVIFTVEAQISVKISGVGDRYPSVSSQIFTLYSLVFINENHFQEFGVYPKNKWMLLISSVFVVLLIALVLIFRKNRYIYQQNKVISKLMGELQYTQQQKQILLAEFQHRVKNNLQHVISILEIQKESVNFNHIDELIRGNQNRIH